ncbi:hypothetical protein C1145_00755, partial [Clostridium botulinum]
MTELGKSLIQEGIEKGKAEGKEEGKAELLIKQLMKNLKKYLMIIKKNKILPEETIELIATDIFQLNSV